MTRAVVMCTIQQACKIEKREYERGERTHSNNNNNNNNSSSSSNS